MTTSTTRLLGHAAFATGLAALAWVAWGALGTNPLALAVTLVMAAFYVAGARELLGFHRASAALMQACAAPPADASDYDRWLDALPAPLPGAVRLRIDHGGRSALPGPTLAPTITGLLVLLGMLGTFLGMVATLHGTGLALEHATELDALRDALSAPVKGLGLAFGTSVAGVATSAMLGLMTALARRERAESAQALDRLIATALRPFSSTHRATLQHEETLRAMQRQADAVPAAVTTMVDTVVTPLMDRLQTMMNALQQQHEQTQQRLLDGEQRSQQRLIDGQAQFHARAEAGFGALSASVERSLKDSIADGARQAHAQLQPLLESAMGGLAREAATLHGRLTDTAQRQIEDITARLAEHAGSQASHWRQALDDHRGLQRGQAEQLQGALDAFTAVLRGLADEATAQHLRLSDTAQRQIDDITARLAEHGSAQAAHWQQALDEHRGLQRSQAERLQGALDAFTAGFEQRAEALIRAQSARLMDLQQGQQAAWAAQDSQRLDAWRDTVTAMTDDLRGTVAAMTNALSDSATAMSTDLREAATAMSADLRGSVSAMTGDFQGAVSSMTGDLHGAVSTMTTDLRDAVSTMATGLRGTMSTMSSELRDAMSGMSTGLRDAWQAAGDHTTARQQQICDTLAETARAITETTQSQARATVDEITRLLQSAAEAPRAAAEVIGELRERLTESMARDDASLRERERLMDTLGTLLNAVNQASTEQRDAIEALVGTASTLLRQAGERLQAQADDQRAALADAATRVQAGAVEMASLGETFGFAVQRYGESNEALMGQLQRIEAALSQSLARSDDQLNYYVAQAREVIDLSLSSQKQIIEDLQALARREAA